jgi:inosine/xanthosine triphosphatase
VGGTFNIIHSGHRELLARAFSLADDVLIGITSDAYAARSRDRVNPLKVRIANLEACLQTLGGRYSVHVIEDHLGPAASLEDLDLIVVSEETYRNALHINEVRLANGLDPLEVVMVPMVMAGDGSRLSATQVVRGDYDRSGSQSSLTVAVGSTNPVKVEAVRAVMEKFYGDVRVIPVAVSSGVPEQPWGMETLQGARNRAIAALMDCDLSVGIEAGVFERYDGLYDIQHCAVSDRRGRITYGAGSAFRYPDRVADKVRQGCTVGEAMMDVFHTRDRGDADGAIGVLTQGIMDRKQLTEQAVMAAMVPRLRGDYLEH